ncbi:hypothetical protein SAMN05216480_10237 [Pustulibacterium marinum]|uniref:Uncharacterized protein n=1 Tax=Pustulibacterium marinum TaxID=1224947 RepID=A0A1I7FMV1_9FLAO|nr:hypothetical protein [Pustulibacterium marinum]SFU37468.1 hypothetical protein SAMN05216480_10237 [Pustulibacterium marinum]
MSKHYAYAVCLVFISIFIWFGCEEPKKTSETDMEVSEPTAIN